MSGPYLEGVGPISDLVSSKLPRTEVKKMSWISNNLEASHIMQTTVFNFEAGQNYSGAPLCWRYTQEFDHERNSFATSLNLDTEDIYPPAPPGPKRAKKAKGIKAECLLLFKTDDCLMKWVKTEFNSASGSYHQLGWIHYQMLQDIYGENFSVEFQIKVETENVISNSSKIIKDLSKALKDEVAWDFTIKVPISKDENAGFYSRKVQRGILAARSSVFETMFSQKDMLENRTGEMTIEDLSPKGLVILLKYIYTDEISQDWVDAPLDVVNAAEKYNLPELKEFCDANLIKACNPQNALAIFKVAQLHKLQKALKDVTEYIHQNTKTVLFSSVFSVSV